MHSVTTAQRQEIPVPSKPGDPNTVGLPELSFVHPIPGFSGLRRFVLVRLGAGSVAGMGESDSAPDAAADDDLGALGGLDRSPLYELRSLEQPDIRFVVAVPSAFFSDYEIELDDQECGDLGLTESADALVLVMLTVGADAKSTTANLLARP